MEKANYSSWYKKRIPALRRLSRSPRAPAIVQSFAAAVFIYCCSPISIVPKMIPVLGRFDDFFVIPFLIWGVMQITEKQTWDECERLALNEDFRRIPTDWRGGIVILFIWGLSAIITTVLFYYFFMYIFYLTSGFDTSQLNNSFFQQ